MIPGLVNGWTAQKYNMAQDEDGAYKKNWVADSAIGTFKARRRQLSAREAEVYHKTEYQTTWRVYAETSGINENHRLVSPDGEIFNIIAVNNPHDLDKFYQIDVVRGDLEKEDE